MELLIGPWQTLLLVAISLIGGIGITAIGPGGILVTIALFLLTDLSPAAVAGTAIATQMGTGAFGSLVYLRSGQLHEPPTRHLALVLSATAIIGTPIGAALNSRMSGDVFAILLAAMVVTVGISVLARERRNRHHSLVDQPLFRTIRSQGFLGGTIALVSGIFGIGGPMLSVPILVMGRTPILQAIAAAQAQSVVVAVTGAVAYFSQGVIVWSLVLLTGVPQLVGVWIGWRIAHTLPRHPLAYALAITLIALGPIIAVIRSTS